MRKSEPNLGKSKSIYNLAMLRYSNISRLDDSTLLTEAYYEVIKELLVSLLARDGYKPDDHVDIIKYMYKCGFEDCDFFLIDELRKRRNQIQYDGLHISSDYLRRNKPRFNNVIMRLKKICENKF
jgi:hypothetical protein